MQLIRQMLKDPVPWLVPLAWLLGAVVAGLIVRTVLFRFVRKWAAHTESKLDVLLIESLRGPIVLWSIILGVHLATQNSEIPRIDLRYVPTTLAALWIVSLTMAMSRFAGNAIRFYGGRFTGAQAVTSLTQKLAQLAVVAMGIGLLLRLFNVSLTPILTTLGVGGLAVALALQDTLSNLFAGFYVSISGLVHVGDYIKLNTGEEGFVTDINWRCTTLRSFPANNFVVVPNSKLGQAIYTNYNMPEPRMVMSISFSVGYDSDVDGVEKILLEEASKAASEIPGLLAVPAPLVLFNPGPGEWALGFTVVFSVSEFRLQGIVQSDLRKRIYKRLSAEGITLPFPTRTVLLEQKNHG